MKNKINKISSYIIAIVSVVLLVLLSDLTPWMPPMGATITMLVAAVLLIIFAGFVMKEKGGDERDAFHRLNADRVAYLSSLGVLIVALVIQGFSHAIDPWVLVTLGVMVIAKVIAHYYSAKYH